MNNLGKNIYYVKSGSDDYADVTTKWEGLYFLQVEGLTDRGAPKNIGVQEWVNSNKLDVYIPDTVYYATNEVKITFIVRDVYNHSINVRATHDAFISYMTSRKVSIKSLYDKLENEIVCQSSYEPTTILLSRPAGQNAMVGTLTLKKINSTNTEVS